MPQGAPTSPAISNLIAFRLDRRLAGLAEAHGFSYTRYADDLAFSGDHHFGRGVQHWIAVASSLASVGLGLAIGAAWALAKWVFDSPFAVPVELAVLALGLVIGTALLGLINSRDVVRRPPLEVLRTDG